MSTAFHLAAKGIEVTILEKNAACAAEASYANGSQLSYTYAEPLASPGLYKNLIKWTLFPASSPLGNHDKLNPMLWKWQMQLLSQASSLHYNNNKTALLALALHSRTVMQNLLEQYPINFSYSQTGKLHLYHEKRLLDHAQNFAYRMQDQHGISLEILSSDACLQKEPLLQNRKGSLVGGMYSAIDAAGDCNEFTTWLATWLREKQLANIHYNTAVQKIICNRDSIEAIDTTQGTFTADAYVLAAGFYSRKLARDAGLNLPIYPIKGYALTLPITAGYLLPKANITDHEQKIVLATLGNRLRASGLADMDGNSTAIRPERVEKLKKKLSQSFPDIPFGNADIATGMRPYTPSSTPYIGPTPVKNLFLNTGHGMLGWTLSQGSASLLTEYITHSPLSVPIEPYLYPF